jgi:tetratricopeptide (TPR) repeat protein
MIDRIDRLMRLLEADPNDTFCLYGLAQEHAKAGRHEEAVGWFDRTLAADGGYLYAYYHKARSLEALGRLDEAREALKAGLDRSRAAADGKAISEFEEYLRVLR